MNAINATWKNGQIVPDEQVDWPEGCRLVIEPVPSPGTLGLREEDWPDTPEGLADWQRWYDSLEPLLLTPDEEAAWRAARQAQKDFEKANFDNWARGIEGKAP